MTRKTKEAIIGGGWVFVTGTAAGITPFGPWLYAQGPLVAYVIWRDGMAHDTPVSRQTWANLTGFMGKPHSIDERNGVFG